MPGLSVYVGRTEEEANEKFEHQNSLMHPVVAREILSTVLGNVDLSAYDFDGPLPNNLPQSNASQSTFKYVTELAKKDNLSMRQIAQVVAGARAKMVVKGSPKQVADHMEESGTSRRGRRRLQHHAALSARRAQRFRRTSDSGVAAARPVPHRIHRPHPARAISACRAHRAPLRVARANEAPPNNTAFR